MRFSSSLQYHVKCQSRASSFEKIVKYVNSFANIVILVTFEQLDFSSRCFTASSSALQNFPIGPHVLFLAARCFTAQVCPQHNTRTPPAVQQFMSIHVISQLATNAGGGTAKSVCSVTQQLHVIPVTSLATMSLVIVMIPRFQLLLPTLRRSTEVTAPMYGHLISSVVAVL